MSGEQKHQYHLVEPSPWPALGSAAGFTLFLGLTLFMHEYPYSIYVLMAGLFMVLATMFFWWRDVVREAEYQGHHTPIVQIGMRYGMIFFICSEVMFFVAFFWAFFDASLLPKAFILDYKDVFTGSLGVGIWPPEGIETFDPLDIPYLNTLILLLSGTTCTWAHHAVREGHNEEALQGLYFTVFLGAIFTCLQVYEYQHATFGFTEGIYPSTFYMATGFHGFHVLVGTIFLLVCLMRARKGHLTPERHFGFEAAAWYWHFVDVVWLFLFVCIYWWGG